MDIQDFTKHTNKQRPRFAYEYRKIEGELKYHIFTMNGGQTFICNIDRKRLDGRYYTEFSETHETVEECLAALEKAEV